VLHASSITAISGGLIPYVCREFKTSPRTPHSVPVLEHRHMTARFEDHLIGGPDGAAHGNDLSRRAFVRQVVKGTCGVAILGPTLFTATPARAVAWMAAMAAFNFMATAMSLFVKRGNGMAAMMQVQMSLLNIAIEQLGQIRLSLLEISQQIKDLPKEFAIILARHYNRQLGDEIRSTAGRYAELLTASRTDPGVFSSAEVRRELQGFQSLTSMKRIQLSGQPGGNGAETALLVPIAFSLEIATLQRLGYNKSIILATIDVYEAWLLRMLGPEEGSILSAMKAAALAHNEMIESLKDNGWSKKLGLPSFKLGDTPTGKSDSFCYVLNRHSVSGETSDQNTILQHLKIATNLYNRPAHTLYQSRALSSVEDKNLGTIMIQYDAVSKVGTMSPAELGKIEGELPPFGTMCTMRGNVAALDMGHDKASVEMAGEETAGEKGQEEPFKLGIDFINLQRAQLTFCNRAASITQQTLNRAREYREILR
jgi:hypothetical protein